MGILYDFFVRKNRDVKYEYERYVQEHLEEHYSSRLKHWKILFNLNWHYRIKKSENPLIYWEQKQSKIIEQKKEYVMNVSNKKNDIKKTYLNEVESRLLNRPQIQHFANRLMNYNVVSFDIFDTLIFRPFDNPNDLFMILEQKNEILDFARIRIEVEKEVRRINNILNGNRECSLDEIYDAIEKRTGLNAIEGKKNEIETELELCYSNPYMKHVFDIMRAKGKRIILISDMYLCKDVLEVILKKCGFNGIEKIFISTEYNVSKSNGGLYEIVKEYLQDEELVHIGDNLEVDIKKARKYGIKAYHYPQCTSYSRKSRTVNMSPLIGSAYRGIVANHIYNGLYSYSAAYEHGFIYGGILALGYCTWLERQAILKKIDKLLFVSRDGKVFLNTYKELQLSKDVEYVYWSRIAHLCTCAEFSKDLYLQRFIRDKVKNNTILIDELLLSLNIEGLREKYQKYHLNSEQFLKSENVKLVEKMISENWDYVLEQSKQAILFEAEYFRNIIGPSKSIGLVDIGWTAYGELDLKKFIHKYVSPEIEVTIFVLGANAPFKMSSQSNILKEEIIPYVFSYNYNRTMLEKHNKLNNRTNNVYVEILSQDIIPSYIGMQKGKIYFDVPEVENYETIKEIHKGILDFVKCYKKKFYNYDYMFAISGSDAFTPLQFSYENLEYYKNKFKDFCFSRTVLTDINKQCIETLEDIIKKM